VKANTTSDGDFKVPGVYSDGTSNVNEIWGNDNKLYGFIIHQMVVVDSVNVKMVDGEMQCSYPGSVRLTEVIHYNKFVIQS
jgi:hypothetical protein